MKTIFSLGHSVAKFPAVRRAICFTVLGLATTLARGADPIHLPVPAPDDPACTAEDRKFMARANEFAVATAFRGNGAYGAVLVKDGVVIMGFGAESTTSHDPTKHAETGLISLASRKFDRATLAACTLYTSTEPCIMCCGAISAAGIKKFVYGVTALQVTLLRGSPAPANPLACREIFIRRGLTNEVILGPVMEAEGLVIHAVRLAATPPPR